jgi:hypothetical protein
VLEIESTHLGQPYVEYQATRLGRPLLVEEFLARRKRLRMQTNLLDEILDSLAHPSVIVDDEYGGNGGSLHA